MDKHEKDDTDVSSLKPVSSLRAQFEEIATRKVTPPPPKGIKPAHLSHVEPERGRSSLDMPTRTSAWVENSQPSTAPQINTLTKPISRPKAAGIPTRQRPMSMGSWSLHGTPPTVTIQSPKSPAKQSDVLKHGRDASDGTWVANLGGSTPLPTPRPKSRGVLGMSEPAQNTQVIPREPSPIGSKKPPPPINRAKKPVTPVVSTFNLNLGIIGNRSQDKISPFNTPPSSDDSPAKEESPILPIQAIHRSNNSTSYFPTPPTQRTVETQRDVVVDRRDYRTSQNNNRAVSDSPDRRVRETPGSKGQPGSLVQVRPSASLGTSQVPPIQPPRPITETAPIHVPKNESRSSRRAVLDILPPPPRRNLIPGTNNTTPRESPSHTPPNMSRSSSIAPVLPTRIAPEETRGTSSELIRPDTQFAGVPTAETPDNIQSNRRLPRTKIGANRIWTQYDTRSLDLCGNYVCTGGYVFRAWDTTNSRMITDYAPELKELKTTSFTFRPGSEPEEEGLFVWIGNNVGEIQEIDLRRKSILEAKPGAHGRREIIKMFRYQNSIWSLDDEGKLLIWPSGSDGVPSLRLNPGMRRVVRGHSCSIIVKNHLWIASGRNVHVYNPTGDEDHFNVTLQPLSQATATEITSAAVISSQLDRVYFGHSDGKVSVYSTNKFTCIGLISASPYKINCLVGAGVYLWAGFNTGMIHVYDTQSKPWKVKKEWQAHQKHPVSSIVVDLSSIWKVGHLQVASLGGDNAICIWDGMLEDDWIENDMLKHDVDFCTFQEISVAIMTWNAGASTPSNLKLGQAESEIFAEAIRMESAPDILAFGFQELVDLENKKLTAKSIFKGSKKKDSSETDHMSHQYRAWRDYLTQLVETSMPYSENYSILHTASMVGLFTCIFVKSHMKSRIRNLKTAEIKRGLGGLHGNKGAIIVRFVLEDSSICFTNCHLAAGQSQTASRNADITAILEAAVLPEEKNSEMRMHNYIGGGDGAMIIDHEICIINGDLNYRIDTMSRDSVIKAINSSNLAKLLERDQLLVSKRRNPGFRLRPFKEQTITFAPTYKYDVGTDRFDTSEKGRSPAWCDRILYRGFGCVKQVDYKRHELRLSDHRPVSGLFLMRIKTVDQERRVIIREQSEDRLADMRDALARDAKLSHLVNILGIPESEARKMLDDQQQ